jgi:hypothetical protein
MRDNEKRRAERARRRQLFDQLKLQADILCESYNNEAKSTIIIGRMMLIILEVIGQRGLNSAKKQALADHFTDSAISKEGSVVELGGPGNRDRICISGEYSLGDLAKRLAWSESRGGQTIENNI